MIGDILKHQDVRRFAVTFGSVFCVGGLALGFFLKAPSTDAVDSGSVARPVDEKITPATQTDEETASISIQSEQDRRGRRRDSDDYRLAADSAISGPSRNSSFAVIDQPFAAQAISNINSGPRSSSNGGSFAVGNFSAASEQQPSAAPTSQATGPQVNDLPGTNESIAGKPMLGKLPRGYTYEELLYRTWYGWGAYNSAQPQDQH